MKTKIAKTFFIVLIAGIAFVSCNKNNLGTPGTIEIKATAGNMLQKSALIGTAAGTLNLQSAMIEIQNLQIEENSGNDNENQQGDQNENDKNEKDKKEGNESKDKKEGKEKDGTGDIVLAGPYVLDISSGSATIDQVDVPAGTYNKVDFNLFAGPENNNFSIVLKGELKKSNGDIISVSLTSDFEAMFQFPLTNGITVSSGSTIPVSIKFDISGWLGALDFESAQIENGSMTISKTKNTGLYNSFIDAVSKNIEVED